MTDHAVTIELKSGSKRLLYHRNSRADLGVLKEIFQRRNYDTANLVRANDIVEAYREILLNDRTPLIVDAGANIGASVLWFSDVFPDAHIVAVEPDMDNARLLAKNTTGLNLDARQAALGSGSGFAELIDHGFGEWAYRTKINREGNIEMMSMADLISEKIAGGYVPFLAKIDIEGGEAELFSKNTDWVDLFYLLIVELHDWAAPRMAVSSNFLKCIAGKKRDFIGFGPDIFSLNTEDPGTWANAVTDPCG